MKSYPDSCVPSLHRHRPSMQTLFWSYSWQTIRVRHVMGWQLLFWSNLKPALHLHFNPMHMEFRSPVLAWQSKWSWHTSDTFGTHRKLFGSSLYLSLQTQVPSEFNLVSFCFKFQLVHLNIFFADHTLGNHKWSCILELRISLPPNSDWVSKCMFSWCNRRWGHRCTCLKNNLGSLTWHRKMCLVLLRFGH